MKIVSRVGNLITLEWGPYRVITVDFSTRKVTYRESSDGSEGYGLGDCS